MAGQESVWDYPRPPALVADSRRIRVTNAAGQVVADTGAAIRVLETASPPTVYIRPSDVDSALLVAAPGSSFCEWKGPAEYWAEQDTPELVVGWSYPKPFNEFTRIAGWYSFYPGRIHCEIDDEVVRPQEGGFYGGWVTNEIVGPWKGQSGTSAW